MESERKETPSTISITTFVDQTTQYENQPNRLNCYQTLAQFGKEFVIDSILASVAGATGLLAINDGLSLNLGRFMTGTLIAAGPYLGGRALSSLTHLREGVQVTVKFCTNILCDMTGAMIAGMSGAVFTQTTPSEETPDGSLVQTAILAVGGFTLAKGVAFGLRQFGMFWPTAAEEKKLAELKEHSWDQEYLKQFEESLLREHSSALDSRF